MTPVKLLDKASSELSVRDCLKINGAVLAIALAVPLTFTAVVKVGTKISSFKQTRKDRKETEISK